MLKQAFSIPDGLLDRQADQLASLLEGPTLLHLPGARPDPLFVSVLMHGNETVGWEAIRQLLRRYAGGRELPRALSLFIGNLTAAAQGVRRLPGQPDYNRVWPGSEAQGLPEQRLMQQVVEEMRRRQPFASVDIHNNTGLNPHYACVNRIEPRFLHLAALFGRTVVYFLRPRGVTSMAMAELCPSVTLECGRVGESRGVEHAMDYLDACLHLAEHPQHPMAEHDIDLFHTVAQVKIREEASIGFDGAVGDIVFHSDIDHMNFRELPVGTALAHIGPIGTKLLDVRDERGIDRTERYFHVEDGELRLRTAVMPSMLTTDASIIRQDCLCYLMERYDNHLHEGD
ncbi:M14 family metallopeptidase [Candidatus Endoriftia persephone]|jgi:succinylglutamate desuccinylase|uniref:Succinylglutamate desuccinylase n=3 Tax=Gammaproteobacteria TaxID=1236 RepID=G2FG43_9GAMM|nr:M14 family metallopeptidase [Candidatus Endoriftia persephone]EGW54276.1 succinylglutamate desuccinylase [endosymbiont of Tevnia jerichonana (vent Tica)]USF87425.1 M14 family metallopeptidase [Candidatus Endoriftia persephone]